MTSPPKLWTAVLQQLELAVATPTDSSSNSFSMLQSFMSHADPVDQLPVLPRAVYKKLIVDMQVPYHLASACCALFDSKQHPGIFYRAMSMLSKFMDSAHEYNPNNRSSTARSSSLAALLQQLRQSGLLQRLPDIMARAKMELREGVEVCRASRAAAAAADAAAAAAEAVTSSSSSGGGGDNGRSSSSSSSSSKEYTQAVLKLLPHLHEHVSQLLQMYINVLMMHKHVPAPIAPKAAHSPKTAAAGEGVQLVDACANPHHELIVEAWQHASAMLLLWEEDEQTLQKQQQQIPLLQILTLMNLATAASLAGAHYAHAVDAVVGSVQYALDQPYYLHVLGIQVVLASFERILLQAAAEAVAARSSSGSRSSNSRNSRGHRHQQQQRGEDLWFVPAAVLSTNNSCSSQQAWAIASKHMHKLTDSQQQLMQLLGCHPRLLLYNAAFNAGCNGPELLIRTCGQFVISMNRGSGMVARTPQQQQQQKALLLQLLPPLLLKAVQQEHMNGQTEFVQLAKSVIGMCSFMLVDELRNMVMASTPQNSSSSSSSNGSIGGGSGVMPAALPMPGAQQQQATIAAAASVAAAGNATTDGTATAAAAVYDAALRREDMQQLLPQPLLQELLNTLVPLLQQLQQLQQPSATAASRSHSSSSSGVVSTAAAAAAAAAGGDTPPASGSEGALGAMLDFLSNVGSASVPAPVLTAAEAAETAATKICFTTLKQQPGIDSYVLNSAAVDIWSRNASRLCGVLEGLVRSGRGCVDTQLLNSLSSCLFSLTCMGTTTSSSSSSRISKVQAGPLLLAALAAGPGSPQEQSYISLMYSYSKLAVQVGLHQQYLQQQQQQQQAATTQQLLLSAQMRKYRQLQGHRVSGVIMSVTSAVRHLCGVGHLGAMDITTTSSTAATATATAAAAAADSCAAKVAGALVDQQQQQGSWDMTGAAPGVTAAALTPYVALLARCCLLLKGECQTAMHAAALQGHSINSSSSSSDGMGVLFANGPVLLGTLQRVAACSVAGDLGKLGLDAGKMRELAVMADDRLCQLMHYVTVKTSASSNSSSRCNGSSSSSSAGQGGAVEVGLGCATEQQLNSVTNSSSTSTSLVADQAISAGTSRDGGAQSSQQTELQARIAAVSTALDDLARLMSAVVHPQACNSPLCQVFVGPSELQLVGGRSCVCAGCRQARFCSKACQKKHWKQHKPVCQALAAASAAGLVPAAST